MESGSKPKVIYLRGSFLNPYEVQYLEPLQNEFDLTLAYSRSHRFNVDSIQVPKVKLAGLDYLNGVIPRNIKHIRIPNVLKSLGYEEVLFGLPELLPQFDIVHSQEQSFYFAWQAARLKQKHDFKLLTVQCMLDPFWYMGSRIVKRARLIREQTDMFIARSKRAMVALIGEGVQPERIRVIGHGVDLNRFHPGSASDELRQRLGIEPGRFVLLFAGRLTWAKGIYPLVDSFNLLLSYPRIRALDPLLLIAGKGEERVKLEHRVKLFGIEKNVLFAGKLPYRHVPDLHRLADIFVLPSISERYVVEQFGIVLIEAMASGKPVIAAQSGAIDEVVGDAGLLVPANDSFALFRAFQQVMLDPDLQKEMGARGIERVNNHFTQQIITDKIADAYHSVLSGNVAQSTTYHLEHNPLVAQPVEI